MTADGQREHEDVKKCFGGLNPKAPVFKAKRLNPAAHEFKPETSCLNHDDGSKPDAAPNTIEADLLGFSDLIRKPTLIGPDLPSPPPHDLMSNQAKPDWELKQAAEQDLISFTDDTDTAAYKDALIRELFDALDVVPGQLDVTTRLIHEGYNEVLDLSPLLGTLPDGLEIRNVGRRGLKVIRGAARMQRKLAWTLIAWKKERMEMLREKGLGYLVEE